MITGANLDETRVYRYSLWRIWDETKPRVVFIMLNPITEGETKDNPTVRRCIAFAKEWGYGSLEVVNLFSYRASTPEMLKKAKEPVGASNEQFLLQAANRAERIVLAWGIHGAFLKQNEKVLTLLKSYPLYALGVTKERHPRHPLFMKKSAKPLLYNS
ncbi:DUF1643 domain-containing protein [Priestia filamentosa]|uniref:DUF1643 domain-containing protein n=1 Tax=Priestia filamentosa TaxID=1402861 RepID=UPI003981A6EE